MENLIFPLTKKDAQRSSLPYSSEANKKALFPSQLRELRKEKGISQESVARDLGVSKSTIGLYETGDTLPDAKTLYDLAKYYNVSSDYLLGLSTSKSPNINIRGMVEYLHLSEDAVHEILNMADPDNLGGDPEILWALDILLKGMASHDDFDGHCLLDISEYFKFYPVLEESDFSIGVQQKCNSDAKSLASAMNSALENQLLSNIADALRYLKKKFCTTSK